MVQFGKGVLVANRSLQHVGFIVPHRAFKVRGIKSRKGHIVLVVSLVVGIVVILFLEQVAVIVDVAIIEQTFQRQAFNFLEVVSK